jgi:multidrug resistance protein MdtO
MATAKKAPLMPSGFPSWFGEFLKEELTPYPRRTTLVARMVIAATISMIVTMTFQIPYGAYGAIYALNISRESTAATASAVKIIIVAFSLSGAYILLGSVVFMGSPFLRFLWVVGSLFFTFFALSASANYVAATRFGYLVVITIPLWDRHILPNLQFQDTLWAIGAIMISSLITLGIEVIFAQVKPWDDLLESLAERLATVERVLSDLATDRPVDGRTEKEVSRLSMLGTSRLRRTLRRSNYTPHRAEQLGALISLTGRLIDLSANLANMGKHSFPDPDREQVRDLAVTIAGIRNDLLAGKTPGPIAFDAEGARSVPLLREMEKTVSLIADVFAETQPIVAYSSSAPKAAPQPLRLFVPDAFTNPEHVRFAMRGCLAASLCYFTYNALDWPGISTAVSTCLLTALSTIGASRQKQVMRFAGALLGGVVFGMGAQIFILPHVNSITGFTILYLVIISTTAWLSTSGPRLSYFGSQAATAYCLIHLQEFKIQTSLSVARDRVVGILLGLSAMWLVFDRIWGRPAAEEMKRAFISSLRLMAQFARGPMPKDARSTIDPTAPLRETINNSFDKVRAFADGVFFEFGETRQRDLVLRSQIVNWQPQLRMIFVTRAALLKYRYGLPGFELPKEIRRAQEEFDESIAQTLESIANRMDGKPQGAENIDLEQSLDRLAKATELYSLREPSHPFSSQLQAFLPLSRRIEDLTATLEKES